MEYGKLWPAITHEVKWNALPTGPGIECGWHKALVPASVCCRCERLKKFTSRDMGDPDCGVSVTIEPGQRTNNPRWFDTVHCRPAITYPPYDKIAVVKSVNDD